ncbi:MAG: DNA polymerase III subunit delta [Ignavibacteria bacterium]|nr:DNA polymerase III subunit delta [Ignavibacteria bacterium]
MAKAKNDGKKYIVPFSAFKKKVIKEMPPAMLLFLSEKVLLDELIKEVAAKFIGKGYNPKNNLVKFYSDECEIEEVINECSNLSFLSDKRIVIYKLVKRTGVRGIQKSSKEGLLNYLKNPNPDNILIILNSDKEFTFSNFEDFEDTGLGIYIINTDSETEIIQWVKDEFEDYKISEETIEHLLLFMNPSYDEIHSEIEKLKTYCINAKEVTITDVNLCVGMTKNFDENNLFEAILNRDFNGAMSIYNSLNSKQEASYKETEIYLINLVGWLFIALHKLQNSELASRPEDFTLFRELKIWKDGHRMIGLYKKYMKDLNELKIKKAFEYIYTADRSLKSSSQDKLLVINNLIHNLINL